MKAFNSAEEIKFYEERKDFLKSINPEELADNFPLFITRQELVRYLVRYELFKKILGIKGSIVECGVYKGSLLMLFAKLSSIYEPYAFNREIIGFDTFSGFPSVDERDGFYACAGDLSDANLATIEKSIKLFDKNRPVSHIAKIKLVKGDAAQTIPKYFADHPATIVALLYLDFDIYQPTKVALEIILPFMPKGAIIAFDELNDSRRQGETMALLKTLNIKNYEIKKFPEEPHISYIRL